MGFNAKTNQSINQNNFGDAMSELTELGFETDNVDTEVLDQNANELIDEFYEHYDELCAEKSQSGN